MLTLSDIYHAPRHTHLTQQQTIWWVCFLLQSGDSYQAKMQADLAIKYPNLKLSTFTLNRAIKYMIAYDLIYQYLQPSKRRGQPRKMYQVNSYSRAIVNDFANLWRENYENRF